MLSASFAARNDRGNPPRCQSRSDLSDPVSAMSNPCISMVSTPVVSERQFAGSSVKSCNVRAGFQDLFIELREMGQERIILKTGMESHAKGAKARRRGLCKRLFGHLSEEWGFYSKPLRPSGSARVSSAPFSFLGLWGGAAAPKVGHPGGVPLPAERWCVVRGRWGWLAEPSVDSTRSMWSWYKTPLPAR
jgi:hypothetical protein